MDEDARIEIRLTMPRSTETRFRVMRVNAEFISSFRPLPRERELFARDAAEAFIQERTRSEIANELARILARELLGMAIEGDTINGYSREEWERMTAKRPDALGDGER